MFVLDQTGQDLFVAKKRKGRFHHTSFVRGEPVQSAGFITFDKNGRITFHTEHFPHMSYQAVQSSLRHWCWYGGVHLSLVCDDEIPGWCNVAESRLQEKSKAGKVKEVWPAPVELYDPPAKDDPLQELIEVKDWRHILAQFPGVGPVRANALRDAMLEYKADDTLFQALCWATGDDSPKVRHWGKGIIGAVRKALGVPDGFDIFYTLDVTRKD